MSIAQELAACKQRIEEVVGTLQACVEDAAHQGRPIHEVERWSSRWTRPAAHNHGYRTVDPLKLVAEVQVMLEEADITTVIGPWTH